MNNRAYLVVDRSNDSREETVLDGLVVPVDGHRDDRGLRN
jgi:hypothetical protein